MIRKKAKELYNLLKEGRGSSTIFGKSYYDEETQKIIEVITNECKSTIIRNGQSVHYESDISIENVREIIQQLLSDKNTIKNSLVNTLTSIPSRNIPGITTPIQISKKINGKGLPYIEIEKPLPDSLSNIIETSEKSKEDFINHIIKPYVSTLCKTNPKLSKKHRFSRIFSLTNRKVSSNQQLLQSCSEYLRRNTKLDENLILNTSKYIVYNLLGNENIINSLIQDELNGTSLDVIGQKKQFGYNGMVQNISNKLLDILYSLPNPNARLKEVENIYANIVGQLQALSIEPSRDPQLLEEQIKNINRNINRNRQEYYSENGYRTVDVGFSGQDVGLLRKEHVEKAMKLYSQELAKLLIKSDELSEEDYIKEVAKLHFRFVQIHPFPDGNGRTARAISNMLLLEKNNIAVFNKQNKDTYISYMSWLRRGANADYMKSLYTNPALCNEIEENYDNQLYKLEEYIGITCLNRTDLYTNRNITAELPKVQSTDR